MTGPDKLLTISVAAYNAEPYLERCISSVVSCPDAARLCEIIIVNDGSHDSTSDIAHRFQSRYPQAVRVIDKENGGYGSTVNASLKHATGRYFRLLDADDWVDTEHLSGSLRELCACDVDVALSPYLVCNDQTKEETPVTLSELHAAQAGRFEDLDFSWTHLTMHAMTFRTDLLRQAGVHLDHHVLYTDCEFITQPLRFIDTYQMLTNPLYCYRVGREGQSCDYRQTVRHKDDLKTVIKTLTPLYDEQLPGNKSEFQYSQFLGLYTQLFNACFLPRDAAWVQLRKLCEEMKPLNPRMWDKFLRHRVDIRMALSTHGLTFPLLCVLQRKRLSYSE